MSERFGLVLLVARTDSERRGASGVQLEVACRVRVAHAFGTYRAKRPRLSACNPHWYPRALVRPNLNTSIEGSFRHSTLIRRLPTGRDLSNAYERRRWMFSSHGSAACEHATQRAPRAPGPDLAGARYALYRRPQNMAFFGRLHTVAALVLARPTQTLYCRGRGRRRPLMQRNERMTRTRI